MSIRSTWQSFWPQCVIYCRLTHQPVPLLCLGKSANLYMSSKCYMSVCSTWCNRHDQRRHETPQWYIYTSTNKEYRTLSIAEFAVIFCTLPITNVWINGHHCYGTQRVPDVGISLLPMGVSEAQAKNRQKLNLSTSNNSKENTSKQNRILHINEYNHFIIWRLHNKVDCIYS